MTTPIAPHITAFLRERLARDRAASVHTCDSYAHGFRLLFRFIADRRGIPPSQIDLEHIDAEAVVGFLAHLQEQRGNGARTRNARLAAIRSFMRFLEHRLPASLGQIRQVLAIPPQRAARKLVRHLDAEESQALLDTPDPTTRLGIRDRAMLYLALTGGLRVSELVGLRLKDVSFRGRYLDVTVQGKGRKERVLTLWNSVRKAVHDYVDVRPPVPLDALFLGACEQPLTRAGFESIVRKHTVAAKARCPSIGKKRVSPHVLRHTCALNLLQATGDLRKVALWLGHESIQTTQHYLQADPLQKLEALSSVIPPTLRPGKFRPTDRLLMELGGS